MAGKRKAGKVVAETITAKTIKGGRGVKIEQTVQTRELSTEQAVVKVEPVPIEPSSLPQRKRKRAEPKESPVQEPPVTDPEEPIAIEELASPAEVEAALQRPPAVNSDYLPLPWKGRLGYACLNTYLRNANPPVFSSRTCRIASILEHQHPLQDPTQPEHPTKNRPDKEQPADPERGLKWVQSLGILNARDIIKMVRWNDKYGIKFMRLSSEMFPFASHEIYGYKLAPFASEVLAEAGKVIAELGHRVSCHPGQFTQLGSPRKEVVEASVRDLEFHDELLTLLKLPEQQDRDAVLILHMGGMFGSKPDTLDRFRHNYTTLLSDSIKRRLVLENDDMCWSVHDLLPICQELSIPMVLDFHHHNIIFDSEKIREGTLDIMELFPVIREGWTKKRINQKMHYSEPTEGAISNMSRRKHSARVMTLPPCVPDMDLMIEAKDKEQAVFELMKRFKLPGHERIGEVIPHERLDENVTKPIRKPKKKKKNEDEEDEEAPLPEPKIIPESEVSMGGPEGKVYWPPGREDWLRPKKRERKVTAEGEEASIVKEEEGKSAAPAKKKSKKPATLKELPKKENSKKESAKKETAPVKKPTPKKKKKKVAPVLTPSDTASDMEEDEPMPTLARRKSARGGRVSYKEAEIDSE